MSTRKAPENASGSKGLKPWMKNLIFAAVILVLAAALYFGVRAAHSSKGSGLQATVDFGDGITETCRWIQTTITCMMWAIMSCICR